MIKYVRQIDLLWNKYRTFFVEYDLVFIKLYLLELMQVVISAEGWDGSRTAVRLMAEQQRLQHMCNIVEIHI